MSGHVLLPQKDPAEDANWERGGGDPDDGKMQDALDDGKIKL